jgi:hypothetical protein
MKTVQIQNAVLAERQLGQFTGAELAGRHNVSIGSICKWARKRGMPRLKRGRKAAAVPPPKHLQILAAIKNRTYQEVGAEHGLTRQRVAQIIKRWKKFAPIRPIVTRKPVARECGAVAPRKKEVRNHIISFRLSETEFALLQCRYPEAKSVDRAARGVVSRALLI